MRQALRLVLLLTLFFVALGASTGSLAQFRILIPDDPVAFIGHGKLIDRQGKIIQPDVDFLEKTQEIYIKALRDRLPEADQKTFDNQRAALFGDDTIDRRSGLLAKAKMIEWLLKAGRRHAGRFDQRQEFIDTATSGI